jgi:hypothetical protein
MVSSFFCNREAAARRCSSGLISCEESGSKMAFGEISYFNSNKKNNNDQELGLILTGKGIEKCVMDKNVSLK